MRMYLITLSLIEFAIMSIIEENKKFTLYQLIFIVHIFI